MFFIRRHPITGEEIWQDFSALHDSPEMLVSDLSPGLALTEETPVGEGLSSAAVSYEIQSFTLIPE